MKSEKYKLILLLDEDEFDYYTDVYIELIFGENKITIFKDNLLALKNNIAQFDENIHILEPKLDEAKLGMLLNDYYQRLYEDDSEENTILGGEEWIGEKYCWFINPKNVTWIYQYCGSVIMKVTPVFYGFEKDDYLQEYCKFSHSYKDIFREQISLEQVIHMKQLVFYLYDMLF